jgi:hypothetical protein
MALESIVGPTGASGGGGVCSTYSLIGTGVNATAGAALFAFKFDPGTASCPNSE